MARPWEATARLCLAASIAILAPAIADNSPSCASVSYNVSCREDREADADTKQALLQTSVVNGRGLALLQTGLHTGHERSSLVVKDTPTAPNPERLIYIGVLSGPENSQRRANVRITWLTALLKANPKGRIKAEFWIGRMPSPSTFFDHNQGVRASTEMIQKEQTLQDEAHAHLDIHRIPAADVYSSLADKVLMLLQHGVDYGYQFIVKIDDDMAFNWVAPGQDGPRPGAGHVSIPKRLEESNYNATSLLYFGNYLWDKQAYTSQQGADGRFDKYFGGPCYMLSWALARRVAVDDVDHSVGFATYGSSSEDVDMGKWVAFEHNKSAGVHYEILQIATNMPE